MTNEERDLIDKFVARVGGAANGGFAGSVPASQPSLAPIDPEADRYIAQQFQTHPEARYRITQLAVVQEAALAEAANRIGRLQAELDAARQQSAGGGQNRGFLSSLFGGGGSAAASHSAPGVWNQGPRPPQYPQGPAQQGAYGQPQYAQAGAVPPPPGMQPGMFQRSGSGFLGSALSTAAGVAGGVVAGNVLMDMFSGHGGGMGGGMFGGGGFAGGMPPSETTIVNNYGDAGGGVVDPAWDNATQGGGGGGGWTDNTGGGGGWDDNGGGGGGGGWDDSSGGGGGFDDSSS